MSMTLDLPAHLEDDLKEEAEKEGVPPDEHATLLLYICTALLREDETTPFQDAVRGFLSDRSLDATYLASVLEQLVKQCLVDPRDGTVSLGAQRVSSDSDPSSVYWRLRAWRNARVHQPMDESFDAWATTLP